MTGTLSYRCLIMFQNFVKVMTSNGNRTECSPIRSVIIRVITKSDNRVAGVRFVYHECDYGQNIGGHKVIQITISENEKNYELLKHDENKHDGYVVVSVPDYVPEFC